MRRVIFSAPILLVVSVMLFGATAPPAAAQPRGRSDDFVVMTGGAVVGEGDAVDTLIVFDGGARVEGTVREVVVSFNGDVVVSGSVGEDVIVFRGKVSIQDGARIGGDVRSVQKATVAEGAVVRGDVGRINRLDGEDIFPFAFAARFGWWLAVSVSTLVLGLLLLWLAPTAFQALSERSKLASGASLGWGLLVFIGLPIVAVLALITLVGIPFGLGLLLALIPIYAVGYVTSGWLLGRKLVAPPRSKYVAFLAGWAILRGLALIPFLGGFVSTVATILGLGALVAARRRTPGAPREPARASEPAQP